METTILQEGLYWGCRRELKLGISKPMWFVGFGTLALFGYPAPHGK